MVDGSQRHTVEGLGLKRNFEELSPYAQLLADSTVNKALISP